VLAGAPGARAASAPVYAEAAHSGSYYGSTSTTSPGGGVFEDMALNTTAGQLVCASAWVRTDYPATGASGAFDIWLRGGGASDQGQAVYSGLGNLGNWSQVHACAEATSAHTGLRVQFYPARGSPVVDMDDVDVHASLAANGGFEHGSSPWGIYPGTHSNFSIYTGSAAAPAHSGTHFAATNTSSAGGGIYEDMSLDTSPGQLICGSAWVRTEGSATGASGSFALWLTGGAHSDGASVRYAGLGNGTDWTQEQTCVQATIAHTGLRVQFYPAIGSPTVEIDDVDVHESLAANGGFENGSGPWGTYPNTHSTYDAVLAHLVTGPEPPVVTTPVPTPIPRPKARHTLKVRLSLSWTWRYAITRLDTAKIIGGLPGRTRATLRCAGRGCPRRRTVSATGARHVKRLLRSLHGRRYRAGDVLRITLTAPGYGAERAELVFRYGRLPRVRLL